MRRIVQVEYRSGLLNIREEILHFLGCPVLSVLGSQAARQLKIRRVMHLVYSTAQANDLIPRSAEANPVEHVHIATTTE